MTTEIPENKFEGHTQTQSAPQTQGQQGFPTANVDPSLLKPVLSPEELSRSLGYVLTEIGKLNARVDALARERAVPVVDVPDHSAVVSHIHDWAIQHGMPVFTDKPAS